MPLRRAWEIATAGWHWRQAGWLAKEFLRRVGISLAKARYSGDSAMRAEIEMPKNLHSFIAICGK
ncbi:hypothetical protein C0075_17610 [Rhizobium sp. KAs_5_22]|nr:hypothetical protein C0075_17610 [Rhizobium sp. KAs_5_22]